MPICLLNFLILRGKKLGAHPHLVQFNVHTHYMLEILKQLLEVHLATSAPIQQDLSHLENCKRRLMHAAYRA